MPATTTNPTVTWQDVEVFGDQAAPAHMAGIALSAVCRANDIHPDDEERYWATRFLVSVDTGGWGTMTVPTSVQRALIRVAYLLDEAMGEQATDDGGIRYATVN